MIPEGIRSNNPGNLDAGPNPWLGQTGMTAGRFCKFDTMRNGIRACAAQLLIYQLRHNLTTIAQYITRWAPPNENNTGAYIVDVAHACGADPGKPYDLHDQVHLVLLVEAIIEHENGHTESGAPWCSDADIDNGVNDAIASFT